MKPNRVPTIERNKLSMSQEEVERVLKILQNSSLDFWLDGGWGVDALLSSMRSIHFDVQGFNRTYWDLFVAAGFSVGVFYFFAAILPWQLGGIPVATLALMRGTASAVALSFAAITVVSWRFLFIIPSRSQSRLQFV